MPKPEPDRISNFGVKLIGGIAMNRRTPLLALLATGLGTVLLPGQTRSQAGLAPYPVAGGKPIRLLVGLAAGGSLDFQARTVAQAVAEQTGHQVIVENKPGASMMLAANEVVRAAPDGHTLAYAPSSIFAQNPHTLLTVSYDPFKDFTPITIAARGPLVLTVYSGLGVKTVQELVAWGRANPGKLIFGSFGMGTSSHVYAEAFSKESGVPIVHVPYKGTADAVRDLTEGRIQAYFDAAPTAIINERAGRVKIVGVAAPTRNPFMPNVPTISEQGVPGIDLTSWIMIAGPANMPGALVKQVNAVFAKALNQPSVREAIARGAYETAPGTPEEASAEVRHAYDRWGAMIKQIGLQKQ
jgi:tripartite-type tricarboxylate transporter receptor subunit TctC